MGAQQYVRRPEGEDFNPKNAAAPVQAAAGRILMRGRFQPLELLS